MQEKLKKVHKMFSKDIILPKLIFKNEENQSENESSIGVYDKSSISSFDSDETVIECVCNGKVSDREMTIKCDHCDKWHHRVCSNLLVRQWRFFDKNSDFKWYCNTCMLTKDPIPKHHEK